MYGVTPAINWYDTKDKAWKETHTACGSCLSSGGCGGLGFYPASRQRPVSDGQDWRGGIQSKGRDGYKVSIFL